MKRLIFSLLLLFSLNFVFAVDGTNQVSFYSGAYSCVSNPMEAFWQSNVNQKIVPIFNNQVSIFGSCNNTDYSYFWCCPSSMGCFDGECGYTLSGAGVNDCTDLYTESSCEHAPLSLASELIQSFEGLENVCRKSAVNYLNNSGDLCANFSYCGCVWEENKCSAQWTQESNCGGNTIQTNSCVWSFSKKDDLCSSEDKIIVYYSGSSPECGDRTKTYKCSVSVQLPFFDWVEFILASFMISIIYLFSKLNSYYGWDKFK